MTVNEIFTQVQPALDFLNKSTEVFERLAKRNFIRRWVNRILNRAVGAAATTGNWAPAATTGEGAPAATTGYKAPAATTGEGAPAATTGFKSAAKAAKGSLIMVADWDTKEKVIIGGHAVIVDGKKIKADTYYCGLDGKLVEVDLSDDLFSVVVSSKKVGSAIIKTVIIDGESNESFVYIANGKSAHGKTAEKAKSDLRYKITDRDTSKYKEWKLTDVKTAEAIKITTGKYNSDAFTNFFNKQD